MGVEHLPGLQPSPVSSHAGRKQQGGRDDGGLRERGRGRTELGGLGASGKLGQSLASTAGSGRGIPAEQKRRVVEILAQNPGISLKEACRRAAEQEQEGERKQGVVEQVGGALGAAAQAVGDLFADLLGWAEGNVEELVRRVAESEPVAAVELVRGMGWSKALPLLCRSVEESWFGEVLSRLSVEQLKGLLLALEPRWLPQVVGFLEENGTLIGFLGSGMAFNPLVMAVVGPYLAFRTIEGLAREYQAEFLAWLSSRFDRLWPVGTGIFVTGKLGLAISVPLEIGVEGKEEAWRVRPTLFGFTRIGQLGLSLGASTGEQLGRQLGGIRLELKGAAEARLGVRYLVRDVYEFPVEEVPALLYFMAKVVSYDKMPHGQLGQLFVNALSGVAVGGYRREFTIEARSVASASVAAGVEASFGGKGADPAAAAEQVKQAAAEEKPWWQKLLPEALSGYGLELRAGVGLALEWPKDSDWAMKGKIYVCGGGSALLSTRAALAKIIAQQLKAVDIDLQGQLGLEFVLTRDGKLEFTTFEARTVDHGGSVLAASQGAGTDLAQRHALSPLSDEAWRAGQPGRVEEQPGSLGSWLRSVLPDSLRVEKRISAGSGKMGSRLNPSSIAALSKLDASWTGAMKEVLLTLVVMLSKPQLRRVAGWLEAAATGPGDARMQALRGWQQFQDWLRTGEMAPWLEQHRSAAVRLLREAELVTATLRCVRTVDLKMDDRGVKAALGAGSFAEIDLKGTQEGMIRERIAELFFGETTMGAAQVG